MANQMSLAVPWILGAAVVLTLIIAIANVAALMIAQWTARERELSVRASLGAGRSRIVRLLLTESVLIAAAGGAAGTGVAFALSRFVLLNTGPVGQLLNLSVDPSMFAWIAVITLGAGLLAGLGPALIETQRLSQNPLRALTNERVRQRWRHTLVTAEIAVTVALLVVVGALVDGYRRSFSQDLGFSTRQLIAIRIDSQKGVSADRVLATVAQIEGIGAAAAATAVPLSGRGVAQIVTSDNRGSNPIGADLTFIGKGFFDTLGVALRDGRSFVDSEAIPDAKVTIVNEALARATLGRIDVVGSQIWLDRNSYEIVGVVADYSTSLQPRARPAVYRPLPKELSGAFSLVARTTSDPAPVAARTRRDLAAMPDLTVTRAFALDEIRAIAASEILIATYPLMPLIGMGLFLTAAGIYGVLSFAIARGAREMAVRLAVGASTADLVRQVAWHSGRLIGIGSALAVMTTFGLTRFVRASGGGGSAFDTPSWPAFALPVLIVITVGVVATWVPCRRVFMLNPSALLRAD
jgi:predicted permease